VAFQRTQPPAFSFAIRLLRLGKVFHKSWANGFILMYCAI
jgi:hypothetical protein